MESRYSLADDNETVLALFGNEAHKLRLFDRFAGSIKDWRRHTHVQHAEGHSSWVVPEVLVRAPAGVSSDLVELLEAVHYLMLGTGMDLINDRALFSQERSRSYLILIRLFDNGTRNLETGGGGVCTSGLFCLLGLQDNGRCQIVRSRTF